MDTKTDFIVKATRILLDHGFGVLLHRKDNLSGYGGWFSSEDGEKELVVALDHHMGFEIFIHEYCHFLQWKNKRQFWDESDKYYDILFEWIEKPELQIPETELIKSLETILAIEHDCESIVLKLTKLNPIQNFDRDKYIRAANAYLWSYHINKELRKRPKNPIYTEELLESMPNTFNPDLNHYLDKNNLSDSMRLALLAEYEI